MKKQEVNRKQMEPLNIKSKKEHQVRKIVGK